jgi:hypothetical protein
MVNDGTAGVQGELTHSHIKDLVLENVTNNCHDLVAELPFCLKKHIGRVTSDQHGHGF